MSFFSGLDEADAWLDDWQARLRDKQARARELTSRVMGLRATGESQHGAVRVTVESTGVPVDITLGDETANWRPERVSTEIMAAMRRAQQQLTEAVADAARATVGVESETGRALLESFHARFPASPDEPAEERRSR